MSLTVENLSAGYGNLTVVKDIRLDIPSGNICALMGRNGSGKTTLMRCINTILKPTRGCIRVGDKKILDMKRPQVAQYISMVPQSHHTAFHYSCLDMILMGGAMRIKPWSAPCKRDMDKARKICDEVGINGFAQRPFNQLSGGERQLVMVARALYQEAPIMLLDEPNSHLDFSNQHRMMAFIRQVAKKRGVTVLVTLHDPNLALYYCDQAAMLHRGRILAAGDIQEVINGPVLRQALGEGIQCDETKRGMRVVTPIFNNIERSPFKRGRRNEV